MDPTPIFQIEAQFTVFGRLLPTVDLTPALGVALLVLIVYSLVLAG